MASQDTLVRLTSLLCQPVHSKFAPVVHQGYFSAAFNGQRQHVFKQIGVRKGKGTTGGKLANMLSLTIEGSRKIALICSCCSLPA